MKSTTTPLAWMWLTRFFLFVCVVLCLGCEHDVAPTGQELTPEIPVLESVGLPKIALTLDGEPFMDNTMKSDKLAIYASYHTRFKKLYFGGKVTPDPSSYKYFTVDINGIDPYSTGRFDKANTPIGGQYLEPGDEYQTIHMAEIEIAKWDSVRNLISGSLRVVVKRGSKQRTIEGTFENLCLTSGPANYGAVGMLANGEVLANPDTIGGNSQMEETCAYLNETTKELKIELRNVTYTSPVARIDLNIRSIQKGIKAYAFDKISLYPAIWLKQDPGYFVVGKQSGDFIVTKWDSVSRRFSATLQCTLISPDEKDTLKITRGVFKDILYVVKQ